MSHYKNLTDAELIDLLRLSNHAAFNEIYDRYFYITFVHAYKKLRDEEQAKDIVQDIFISLWFKRERFLLSANIGGYLFTAVRNKVFDLFAHDQVKTRYAESYNIFKATNPNPPTDFLIRERQLQATIDKEIDALPAKMKRIFKMSRKENLTNREISVKLDTTENNVSKHISIALKILGAKLGVILLLVFFR